MRRLTLATLLLLTTAGMAFGQSGGEQPPPSGEALGKPERAGALVGSYLVGDGPDWADSETVAFTCLEACAEVLGGGPTDYQCSTADDGINNLAWADAWGNTSRCDGGTPVAEDFKVGGPTDCGAEDCYVSAYVSDHGACADSENFCYAAVVPAAPTWAFALLLVVLVLVGGNLSRTVQRQRLVS